MQLLQYTVCSSCSMAVDTLSDLGHVMSIRSRGESLGSFGRSVTVSDLTASFPFSKANPLSSFEYPSSAKGWCMFILAVFTCRIMAKMLQGQSKDHTNQVWFVCNQRACYRLVGCAVRISQSAGFFFPLFFLSFFFFSSVYTCVDTVRGGGGGGGGAMFCCRRCVLQIISGKFESLFVTSPVARKKISFNNIASRIVWHENSIRTRPFESMA